MPVIFTRTPPQLDGNADDSCWASAKNIAGFHNKDGRTGKYQTTIRALYDEKNIYFNIKCADDGAPAIKAGVNGGEGENTFAREIWKDDSVELLLQPPKSGQYYHFIINARNALLMEQGQLTTMSKDGSWNAPVKSAVVRANGFYEIEIGIPCDGKNLPLPTNGGQWKGNVGRNHRTEGHTSYFPTHGSFCDEATFGILLFCNSYHDADKTPGNTEGGRGQKEKNALDVPGLQYLCWEKDPYAVFNFDEMPALPKEATHLTIYAAGDEYRSASVVMSNVMDTPISGRILLSDFVHVTQKKLEPSTIIELRSSVFLNVKGAAKPVPDALPKLNEIGEFVLPPGSNKEIYFTVNTGGLEPGTHEGFLDVIPFDAGVARKKIKIQVEVYPFSMPVKRHLMVPMWEQFYNWRYEAARKGNAKIKDHVRQPFPLTSKQYNTSDFLEECVKDMVDHGVNVFMPVAPRIPYPVSVKGSVVYLDPDKLESFKKQMSVYKKYWRDDFRLVLNAMPEYVDNGLKRDRLKLNEFEYDQHLRRYYESLDQCVKDLGFKDYYLYPMDEIYTPAGFAKFRRCLNALAENESKIFLTQGMRRFCAEEIEKNSSSIGLMFVWVDHIVNKKVLACLKKTKKPIGVYNNRISRAFASPLAVRKMPWLAVKYDLQGCGSWCYDALHGDSWESGEACMGERESYVYLGQNGPVPSRRWEAFRAGLEDVEYVYLLREKIAAAKKRREDVSAIESSLNDMVESVYWDNEMFEIVRKRIAGHIIDLGQREEPGK
ncbi:MAG: sugar-binding protein [Verrucomicrobiae bacterium]|nr:sugar-binding protein [Verrucomicrobiae bacterium]